MMASVRDVFFTEIYNQVKNGKNIYVVSADLGAPSLDDFRRDFPERYISVGIAEQNLIQVATGMTWGGVDVVAYGLNPFPVTRAFDQIRCLMAELKTPLTLCVLNAGLCAAECGFTHMPIEDMAMLRTLSNIEVFNPSDEIVSKELAKEVGRIRTPRVIRFDKAIKNVLYCESDLDFEKGFSVFGCKEKAELGIITNGCFVGELHQACANLFGIVKLIDLYKLPIDENSFCEEIQKCKKILSVEENIKSGGLGSMILEIMSDNQLYKPIKRLGLDMSDGYHNVFADRKLIRKIQKINMDYILDVINYYLVEEVV